MPKPKFFAAAAAAALIAGSTLAAPAHAAESCREVAKVKANSMMERVKIKRECRKSMRSVKGERSVLKFKFLEGRS